MKLKILNLTGHALKDSRGEYEYNLCKHLEEEGIEVFDLALYGNNSHYCKNVKMAKKPLKILPLKFGNFFSPSIINEMKKQYDVIHVHGAFWSPIPMQVIIWKKLFRIKSPLIMTTHAFIPDKQKMFLASLWYALTHASPSMILNGIKCLPYRRVDKIICQTKLEKEFIIKEFKIKEEKIIVISNGIDLNRFSNITYDFKKKFDLQNKFTVLYVGQIIELKGLIYLLKAIKILKDQNIICSLIIATYTKHHKIMDDAKSIGIEKDVKVFLDLKEEDLISAYRGCDVFVLPSLNESFPTVLLEAMGSQKPVITTNIGGIPELIKNEFNGILIEPKNPNAIAEKILKIYLDHQMKEKLSQNGYTDVITKYSWKVIIKKIIKQYENLKNS
jgi:glycosyltransferase involved in cell wall biosynthesis